MKKNNIKRIELKSFAKINLSLDVLGKLDNGFHEVSMVMQQILLADDVLVRWQQNRDNMLTVELSTNKYYLPTDERNLAYQAAMLIIERFGQELCGSIRIDIKKRIPVAAGLAGGSSNAAAVLHALNKLWKLDLSLENLCELGAELGSDVPFCIMGQAAANDGLKEDFSNDPLACHCALATGTGTTLSPVKGLKSHLALSKPAISVSTADAYREIDNAEISSRPDNALLVKALKKNQLELVEKNMVNVLENFTLKSYPIVMYTKNKMQALSSSNCALMSGSGPTVFALCKNMGESQQIYREMLKDNKESFWTRTTW